jgi:hypothetical protein
MCSVAVGSGLGALFDSGSAPRSLGDPPRYIASATADQLKLSKYCQAEIDFWIRSREFQHLIRKVPITNSEFIFHSWPFAIA